jgi:hypothetical protein
MQRFAGMKRSGAEDVAGWSATERPLNWHDVRSWVAGCNSWALQNRSIPPSEAQHKV